LGSYGKKNSDQTVTKTVTKTVTGSVHQKGTEFKWNFPSRIFKASNRIKAVPLKASIP
jgi:hypothetical protein